jgi:hypothetical protein
MLYAIRLATPIKPGRFLMPACFDFNEDRIFSSRDMPGRARKFSMPGDAAALVESLPFACEVVSVSTGHEYEPAVRPETNGRV